MKYILMAFLFSVQLSLSAATEQLSVDARAQVTALIKAAELAHSGDTQVFAASIQFPLQRSYPIPPIHNVEELAQCFERVFDDKIMQEIAASDVETDWSTVGWRGTMLKSGDVWMRAGKIFAMNYSSGLEQAYRKQLIEEQRSALCQDLRQFEKPILEWSSKSYHIRIDYLGQDNYRYAAWNLPFIAGENPDLIIENGIVRYDGSGGNHDYVFKTGSYTYTCSVNSVGKDGVPGYISVKNNNDELISEAVLVDFYR